MKLGFLMLLPVALFFVTWQAASWRPKPLLQADDRIFAISPNEQFLACVADDDAETVIVFDLGSGKEILRHKLHHFICVLRFSPDGQHLAVGWKEDLPDKSPDEANTRRIIGVSLLSLKGNYREFQATEEVIFDSSTQLRFAPDGRTLWMALADSLRAWDIESGKIRWQWVNQVGRDSSLPFFSALSQDCRFNFRSDGDGYSVWNMKSKTLLLRTKLPYLADGDLIFSDDGTVGSYYASTPNLYYVVETRTGRRLWQTPVSSEIVFSHGKAISRSGNRYIVRDVYTGKLLYRLPANPDNVLQPIESRFWLYVRDSDRRICRQRLDEPPFYLRPLLLR